MELDYQVITQEIPVSGKGYLFLRSCPPERLVQVLETGGARLRAAGSVQCLVASSDLAAPLQAGTLGGWQLTYVHDMLGMYGDLGPQRPHPNGRLTLDPLAREAGSHWIELLNETFAQVPNAATYGAEALEEILTDQYRCGFARLNGEIVGVYELGFKKEFPEIGSIGLTEAARGKGLGRELLLAVMELLAGLGYTKCWLQVSTANHSAYRLYQSAGFTLDCVLSQWYEMKEVGEACG